MEKFHKLKTEYHALDAVCEQVHALVQAEERKERTLEVAAFALGLLAAEKILLDALFDKNAQIREVLHGNQN